MLAHPIRRKIVEQAGLLEQTKDGRVRNCALQAAPLSAVFSWILRYLLDEVQATAERPETTPDSENP